MLDVSCERPTMSSDCEKSVVLAFTKEEALLKLLHIDGINW